MFYLKFIGGRQASRTLLGINRHGFQDRLTCQGRAFHKAPLVGYDPTLSWLRTKQRIHLSLGAYGCDLPRQAPIPCNLRAAANT